jgi:hypothetical protein
MLTELHGKGGCVCQPAREGKLKCPLIIRPTSEDAITGNVFQALRTINPYWWLSDLLNLALGVERFRRRTYRKLDFKLWKNRPYFPRELLPWPEGSTQVDATLTWDNPRTTAFFEMKYGSDLSPKTSADSGEHGYPSDQLIRNVRVGLLECGWFQQERLFSSEPRDFVLILVGPGKGHPLVQRYRDPKRVLASIPHSDKLPHLPQTPFVGELGFLDIVAVLRRQRRWFSKPERQTADDVADYLEFKASHLRQLRQDASMRNEAAVSASDKDGAN